MKEIRYLDKLIDEPGRGKAMERILRGYVAGWRVARGQTDRQSRHTRGVYWAGRLTNASTNRPSTP